MINPMRLSGLATGMDTDTMVKQMMTPYKAKVDSVKQSRDIIKVQQNSYREVLKDFRDIYSKYLDRASTASTNLILNTNYQTLSFSSNNDGVVTASGTVGAKSGTYTVAVKQIACAETLGISVDKLKGQKDVSLNFPTDKKDTAGNVITSSVTVDLSDAKSGGDILTAINNAIAKYNKDSENKNKIDIGVSFSELSNSISIKGNKTGAENNTGFYIKFKEGSTFPPLTDGKVPPKTIEQNNGFSYTIAQDALVRITDPSKNSNCADGDFKNYSSNIFTIDNVQYTINGVSPIVDGKPQPIALTGKGDTKNLIDNIKKFVSDYNDMVDRVSKKLNDKLNRSYKPLTDDQKKEMKEDEIKLWNEKVKQGQIRNDSTIQTIMNDCLNIFSTNSNSAFGSLKDIGISLNPEYRTQKGKLVLDESKLTEALTESGDKVKNLLLDTDNGAFKKLNSLFYDVSMSSTSPLLKKAGYEGSAVVNDELTKKITEKDTLIYNLEKSLATREQGFYSKFAALEKAMNQMNAQQSWLAQSLGGGK